MKLAFEAIKAGHSTQVVLNAADEVLVNDFINKQIKFIDIPNIMGKILNEHKQIKLDNIDDILYLDQEIRGKTIKKIK